MGAPQKADWREERRERAWKLKEQGWRQKDNAAGADYLGHLFRNGHSENNYPNRLEQIVADTKICGSGNDFILPVILVQGSQEPFWEQLKFTLISCIRE